MIGSGIRKYVCSYCQKSYGKSEHLKRHERVHTGVKPYTCPLCKSVFSRQDSLSRHVKRHEEETHSANTSSDSPESSTLPSRTSSRTTRSTPQHQKTDEHPRTPEPRQRQQQQQRPTDDPHHGGQSIPLETSTDPAQDDSYFQLNWPDSQILLDSILSTDLPAWSANAAMSLPNLNMADPMPDLPSFSSFPEASMSESTDNDGTQAVRDLSYMITNALSVNVTAEALSLGLTTAFLDNCLQAFWDQFVPTFPMVHAPTFVFRDWTYPLLLNAIAIGSLFTEQGKDRAMGESLWRLAYTAVATSWQILIKHKGPYDSCCGVQLVLTALLGQVYAIHSQNDKIRMISRAYHSLGFFWAQDSGMYDVDKDYPISSAETDNESPEEQDRRWRTWASREIQLRAMVGHYILDGQVAQYNGGRLSQRHTANPLSVPCSNDVFTASTPAEWARVIGKKKRKRPVFRDLITSLFSHHVHVGHLGTVWILPTIKVVLEALKSLTYEIRGAPAAIIGCPSRADIAYALSRTYQVILENTRIGPGQRVQGAVQWHATALEACIDTNQLCQDLVHRLSPSSPSSHAQPQTVLHGKRPDPTFDPARWWSSPRSPHPRRALLHALAIHDHLADLPLGHAKSMHLPAAVFTAALVFAAARTAPGPSTVLVPAHIHWESLIQIDLDTTAAADDDDTEDTDAVRRYLFHGAGAGVGVPPSSSHPKMTPRNLPREMALFTMTLHNAATVWGVATEFLAVLDRLAAGYQD